MFSESMRIAQIEYRKRPSVRLTSALARRSELAKARQLRYQRSPKGRYLRQKVHARERGISFLLTFDQWWAIWAPQWEKRGKDQDQLCMARFNDIGPYAIDNVAIVPFADNLQRRI